MNNSADNVAKRKRKHLDEIELVPLGQTELIRGMALTIDVSNLVQASEQLSSAALRGASWRPALDLLGEAAGADAVLICRPGRDRLHALTSAGLDAAHRDLSLGKTPPFSANVLIPVGDGNGFVSDAAPPIRDRLRRVPIFRDYVVPVLSLPYRATAAVAGPKDVGGIRISFWRNERQGAFSADEADRLNAVLPPLRSALVLAQQGFCRQIERDTLTYRRAGELVFQLDVEGKVLKAHHDPIRAFGDLVTIRNDRLACSSHSEQVALDCAIARAILLKPSSVVVRVTRARDCSVAFMMFIPIMGEAVEALSPAAVIGVLIDPAARAVPDKNAVSALRAAAELTLREAEIVGRISVGETLNEITESLGIGIGTARNYLKSAMQKCGVHTQVELAALVRRFG